MRRTHRLVVVGVLGACLLAALVAYGGVSPLPERGIYPDGQRVADNPDAHVGDRVVVSGPVVAVDPPTLRLRDGAGDSVTVVVETRRRPAVGDGLTAFGVLRPDGRLDARDAFVVDESGLTYTYTVSALAGLWVLARLVRGWRVDASLAVVRRDRPLGVRGLLAAVRHLRGDDGA